MAGKQYKRKNNRKIIIFMIVIGLFLLAGFIGIGVFTIQEVEVEGNEHYSEKEIEGLVIDSRYAHNSLYLYWKYNYTETKEIPFIDTLEVELISPDKVKIRVYEKDMVGYIKYLESYMYFDKDGIVVESSTQLIEGVPLITGLKFDHIMLHEKLPVEKPSIFKTILNLTQSLKKTDIVPDRIYFDDEGNMVLYFDKVRVLLGNSSHLDEKIIRLQYLLPNLTGLEGSLHMENFDEETKNITFEKE